MLLVVRQRCVYSPVDELFRRMRLVESTYRSGSKQAERGIRSLIIATKKYGSILDIAVKNLLSLMDTDSDCGSYCFSVLERV